MSTDEKAALAALEKHAGLSKSHSCLSCAQPYVDQIDLLLTLAIKHNMPVTTAGLWRALKQISPDYPRCISTLGTHLREHREELYEKARG